MIKFFRQIRKKLLSENRLSKYLIYAIGEIILVVIGILIALQINNWNELKKDNLKEIQLLKSLKEDFSETQLRLKETIDHQEQLTAYSRRLLILYESNELIEKADSVPIFICRGVISWWRAEPVTGTYDAMISTGSIELLKSKLLKTKLADFDSQIKSGFEDHESNIFLLNQLRVEQSPYGFNAYNTSFRNFVGLPSNNESNRSHPELTSKVQQLNDNHRFFDLVSWKLVTDINRLKRQKYLLDLTNNILEILQNELEIE